MFGKIRIGKHQRGLWFRHGDFHRLMKPGKYRLWSRVIGRLYDRVQVVSTLITRFEHPLLDVLVDEPAVRDELSVLNLAQNERALIWCDNRLAHIVGPGRHAFWKEPYDLTIETFDASTLHFAHARLDAIVAHPDAAQWLGGIDVDAHEEVVLFHNASPAKLVGHGRHVYWKGAGRVTHKTIDRREQIADVAGQEIMTRDKVTLRVNLLVTYQVVDSLKAVTVVSDHAQALYREAQLALRAAIGGRALDALLTDKETVGAELADVLSRRARSFGVEVRGVGLRDIILPGEMKTILNQVIEAEKQAQANLIRRREETAAARSQANTAKLISENPTLARMKELEAVADILAGSRATFVFGQGDLTEQFRGLVAASAGKDE